MKRVNGSQTKAGAPSSGGPAAMPIDSIQLGALADTLHKILAQLELTNELLMEIGK